VATWHFHRLPEVFGAGRSFRVSTEDELDAALVKAAALSKELVLIEAMLDPWDHSPALRRLTERLREKI
jgi:indolepyruvate decarboxylase